MAHKYDIAKTKKRRVQFLVLLVAGFVGRELTENLIVPTTPLEENLFMFAEIGFLLAVLIALAGLLLHYLAELIHYVEHPQ